MRAALLICAISVGACASGKPGVFEDGGGVDTNVSTFEDAGIDAPPKNGFGEPCTSNMDCESGLCILVGTSGQCTETCGDCPPGYGCLGVTGIQIEGQVTFVCVPTSTQLCTTCVQDSECTLIGMDKCVTYPDGDKACAQDCSKVGCPTGFTCQDVEIAGVDYKQCMADSMACDCTAANPGAMQPCNIMTPWNVCLGSQTCAGASGWGACEPPSMTDNPDASYTDDNCDGLDGDLTRGIFVAGGGADTATCGLTYTSACKTISHGIIRAATVSRPHVYVQSGTYNEVVTLVNGVSVYGGYDLNWQRDAYSDPAHRVTIVGTQDDGTNGDGEWLAVRAHGLIVPVTLADLVIRGPNAQGTSPAGAGKSSYAIHVDGGKVDLARVQILAGNGAPGAVGSPGANAVSVDRTSTMDGKIGGAGAEKLDCDGSTRGAGGGRGTNTCSDSPSARDMDGGNGGRGGTMDTSCPFSLTARPGDDGAPADYRNGSFGAPGSGGSGGDSCGTTTSGGSGMVSNGPAGSGGSSGGLVSNGYWYARSGNNGGTGENGGGGGGGGGAGGCDDGTDSYGAGGGGGGAGGCAARGGGGGGGGGGGSFGIFATSNSIITITSCELVRGTGGSGGSGGTGGRGQSGGLAGPSNPTHPGGKAPGAGGAGAHGGHGGGGGGGTGGVSVGIGYTPGTTVTGSCMTSGGTAGSGGAGGVSASTAPLAERDGNNGGTGATGAVTTVRACASLSSC